LGLLWATVLVPGVVYTAVAEDGVPNVVTLTGADFAAHIKDHRQTLVEFYAPWCGHCKKLDPEYEKAATVLKEKGVKLVKIDAIAEKDLAAKYSVKGFPTLVWFDGGEASEYDGGRTSDTIIAWVVSMVGADVSESAFPPDPTGEKPVVTLHAESLLPGFEAAAKANRRKAAWYFTKVSGFQKVVLRHKGEEPLELLAGSGDKNKVSSFVMDNVMPMIGSLDGDTFDKYMDAGKGMVWSLFQDEASFEAVMGKHRPMLTEVAKKFRGKYFVTMTDLSKHKEAVENTMSTSTYPAIAVQQKAGDKKKYVYTGEMTATNIIRFIEDVDEGFVAPMLKSEAEPTDNAGPVRTVVGSTLKAELFRPDKDVMLSVVAPWCGHCKKLDPEFRKFAKKVERGGLSDLISIGTIDGVANDSPLDNVEWTGFPTVYFAKMGSNEVIVYDGERSAKGLLRYIKKHATKAQEIRERLEKLKAATHKGAEL